jgi:hypothetical protein
MTFDEAASLHARIIALGGAMAPIESEVASLARAITGCGDAPLRERLCSAWTPMIERLCDVALVADEVTTQLGQGGAKSCPGQGFEAMRTLETSSSAFAIPSAGRGA